MLRKLDKLTSKLKHWRRQETLTFNRSVFRKFQLSLVRCSRLEYRKPVFIEHAFFYLIIVNIPQRIIIFNDILNQHCKICQYIFRNR